jgi:hypothetical protein
MFQYVSVIEEKKSFIYKIILFYRNHIGRLKLVHSDGDLQNLDRSSAFLYTVFDKALCLLKSFQLSLNKIKTFSSS